jgi:pimeloyl-ACP methyl ester carboxylesterase
MTTIFHFRDFRIEYAIYGEGNENILCFHGFGRSSSDFEVFVPLLKPGQRMICLHLFAHEHSVFPEKRIVKEPLQREEWREMLVAFLDSLGIGDFHLVGYSMGGRVVLVTMLVMSSRIRSVLLLATDGLKINPLYRFASGTAIGHALYLSIINNPKPLFAISRALNKLGLLSDKLLRFVFVHLDTLEKRRQVHDAWMIYRLFFPDFRDLAAVINPGHFPFHMIFGKFDEVIKPVLGEKLQKHLTHKNHLHIVELGHRLMRPEIIEYVRVNGLWA